MSTQTDAASRILTQALAGTPTNPGLPATLAQLLVGQSGNETGGWTSNFFVNNNNCFGYSCVAGATWQDGCSQGNADNGVQVGNYASIEDSTSEMIDWIYRRVADGKFPSDLTTITTPDQYASLLKNAGYYQASESSYAANIQTWLTNMASLFHRH